MSEKHQTTGEERAGADHDSAPVADAEVVDTEVVEEAEVVDAEVVDDGGGPDPQVAAADGDGDGDESEPAPAEPDPLADALRERAEYLDLARRARADFENLRKRASAQSAEAEQRGRATLARGLLPAIDNLGRALLSAGIDPAAPDASGDGLAKGVSLVYGELRGALERSGVVAFDPAGECFDPNIHEAISTMPAEGSDPGTVIETLELGYRVDQQVIRPARVVVSG